MIKQIANDVVHADDSHQLIDGLPITVDLGDGLHKHTWLPTRLTFEALGCECSHDFNEHGHGPNASSCHAQVDGTECSCEVIYRRG